MGWIYAIVHEPSRKRYIGSTTNLKQRRKQHFTDLRCGRHANNYLQNAFAKHGESKFSFEILQENIKDADLLDVEKVKILEFDTINPDKGYNLTAETKAPMRGKKMSEENKKKMSESRTGSKHPRSKITEEIVKTIFDLHAFGNNQSEIAAVVGVSPSNISHILRGDTWDHVGLCVASRCNNRSGCVGVYFDKRFKKWKAEIIKNKKYHGLGYFDSKDEAVFARKSAEVSLGI